MRERGQWGGRIGARMEWGSSVQRRSLVKMPGGVYPSVLLWPSVFRRGSFEDTQSAETLRLALAKAHLLTVPLS